MNEADLRELANREQDRLERLRCRVLTCASSPCLASGGGATHQAFRAAVAAEGLGETVEADPTGCAGVCSRAPVVRVRIPGQPDCLYEDVTPDVARRIVAEHLVAGRAVVSNLLPSESPVFDGQVRIALSDAGEIDPERIEDYLRVGGYRGLARALVELTPAQVVSEVVRSGLRGRGGAGFSTGVKWGLVARAEADQKYVVCNGDEGDPGAYMDRTILEGDPHRLLEGMAIAGYAVGATRGYIYVRGEYPLAVKRLELAIRAAEERGLLGARILETPFQFRLDIRIGGGAYVCGEETALIASIEGGRGNPRPRPPFPAQSGLWGKPTLINNVETLANVAPIILNGGDWYASHGTEKSRGTKVFALGGRVNNPGVIEVPLGMPLRQIVYGVGGGIPDGRPFKAAQTGGPSGGVIPAELLDVPVDYESLAQIGSIVGSGGLIVLDDTSCMVDLARFYMDFCVKESCGKCVPCRAGTLQALRILDRMSRGEATPDELGRLEALCAYMKEASLCGLGQNAPNVLLSALRYFRDELLAHVERGQCPAGVCAMQPPVPVGAREVLA